jgi:hypothetical protein
LNYNSRTADNSQRLKAKSGLAVVREKNDFVDELTDVRHYMHGFQFKIGAGGEHMTRLD